MNRILIVDSQVLFRNTLRGFLSQVPDFHVVGVAGSMRDAIWSVGSLRPDLVLTELTMPDARDVEAVAGIKRHYPEVKVLVLSYQCETDFKRRCCDAGAAGYVVKDAIHDELLDVMRAALDGKSQLGAAAPDRMVEDYLRGSSAHDDRHSQITQRLAMQ